MWRPLAVLALVTGCLVTVACGDGGGDGGGRSEGRGGRAGRSRLLDDEDPLGSPGELAWQAWLLMDGADGGGGGGDVGAGDARRITPKSVFIAPAFAAQPPAQPPPCAEGLRRDAAGRCVQVLYINRDAQLNFLLQRLNALHARPTPGRQPLPLPLRQPDGAGGPFRVRLRVPLPSSSTTTTTTTTAATTTTTTTEPPQPVASVVMTDVSKRSSNATDEPHPPPEPIVVEIPMTTSEEPLPETTTAPPVTSTPAAAQAPPADRPPKDALPATTEVPDASAPPAETEPATPQDFASTTPRTPLANNEDDRQVVQSDDAADDPTDALEDADEATALVAGEEEEEEEEDDTELGSADVMEQIEVVPISDHTRQSLPIWGEDDDQDTSLGQAGVTGEFPSVYGRAPLSILHSSSSQDESPSKFTSNANDEPQRVQLFKGNYVKFPTENTYRYKHRPVTDEHSGVRQSYWWLPSNWRTEQLRQQAALQDYWQRTSASEDSPHYSEFNPTYHVPLPYQQRQAQYDTQWSSIRKHKTS